jgi:hypothetical protein
MDKPHKHKKLLITLISLLTFFGVVLAAFFIYVSDYYHAQGVKEYLQSSSTFSVVKEDDSSYSFVPNEECEDGIIFYPGGKVENTAYAPLCYQLASQGIYVYLTKMPFNLAVFNSSAAEGISNKKHQLVSNWYLAGHSLGGAMAASYISSHASSYKGLILLGAYATNDLSSSSLRTCTIYGSEDKVMNKAKYDSDYSNLPSSNKETVIKGGCHAYFGNYGAQKGDGTPSISALEQQQQTVQAILDLLK